MNRCGDCVHYTICSPHTTPDETFPEVEGGCKLFKNKADFVEVVRCKNCDIPHNKWTGCPKLNGLIPPPNHFCACGERKKEGAE